MSSLVSSNLCCTIDGVFIKDRQLQIYDMLKGLQIAEMNVPNAMNYSLDRTGYESIGYLDDDQLIFLQDSPTRICLMSVNALVDTFSQSKSTKKINDITIKIDPILGQ